MTNKKDAAIVAYVDVDEWGILEAGWLYRSWLYSGSNRRSDLLFFYNPDIDVSLLPSGEGVKHIPVRSVVETDPLWEDYPRVNSTYFLTTPEAAIVLDYRYTFRTDLDVFLTKNFASFYPRLAHFGLNIYETEGGGAVGDIIGRFCKAMEIQRYHMNIDCHIMAGSPHVLRYAKFQFRIATILRDSEFRDGFVGAWPGWYKYVINMYSAGIAANACFKLGANVGGFSVMSMSHDPIGSNDYHIHAWHTSQHFSKMAWRDGVYDVMDHDSLDDNIINQYCIKMAGKRFE